MADNGWTHITLFDRHYSKDKQAEGLAIIQAVVSGQCDKYIFLEPCSTGKPFQMPASTWCMQKKSQILKKWEKGVEGNG